MGSESNDERSEASSSHHNELLTNPSSTVERLKAQESASDLITIFYRPRATIRRIVDSDPRRHVILLAALSGIMQTLDRASGRDVGDKLPLATILILAVVMGPIGGILSLYILGFLLHWSGRLLGGVATREEVRAAIAWGLVPKLLAGLLWIPALALIGHEMFTTHKPLLDQSRSLQIAILSIAVVPIVLTVWAFVTHLKCLGEVQRFSAWRALISGLLVVLVLVIFVLILAAVFVGFSFVMFPRKV